MVFALRPPLRTKPLLHRGWGKWPEYREVGRSGQPGAVKTERQKRGLTSVLAAPHFAVEAPFGAGTAFPLMTQVPAQDAEKPPLRVVLCSPRGFCAGVVRAIDSVERALALYGPPVYVRHEIVHNRYVVETLKAKGAIFVEELDEIPDTDAPVIFSAHGVPRSVPEEARKRNFLALDATCPLVTKVHREAQIHFKRGLEIVLIGHAGHPEVVGTLGQLPDGAVRLVETLADAQAFIAEGREQARFRDADHALARRHRRDRGPR